MKDKVGMSEKMKIAENESGIKREREEKKKI